MTVGPWVPRCLTIFQIFFHSDSCIFPRVWYEESCDSHEQCVLELTQLPLLILESFLNLEASSVKNTLSDISISVECSSVQRASRHHWTFWELSCGLGREAFLCFWEGVSILLKNVKHKSFVFSYILNVHTSVENIIWHYNHLIF